MVSSTFRNRWLSQSSMLIYSIVVFIGLAIAWSFWAELDQVSRAPGQVIPTGRIQTIQSTDGGQIAMINVREGDFVRKDELLVQLEDVKLQAGVAEARRRIAMLQEAFEERGVRLTENPDF